MSRINETLKQRIDELDLDRRLNDVVDQAEDGLRKVVETAGGYAHDHRDDIERALDKVAGSIEDRTEGRYADRVDQLRHQLGTGLDRLAERRPDGTDPTEGA